MGKAIVALKEKFKKHPIFPTTRDVTEAVLELHSEVDSLRQLVHVLDNEADKRWRKNDQEVHEESEVSTRKGGERS